MACRFHSPTIVGWMPCFVANWAVVSSPRSASSATFALNSAKYRFRLLVIQVRPSQERTELKPLSEIRVPPQSAPLALGLFAGVTEFIPVIGPILGAVPAILLALTQGGWTALWTLLLFVVVQQIESNLIMPLVQRRLIEIPPALLLFALLAIGL